MDQSSFHFHEKKRVVVKIGSSSLNYEETGSLNFTKLEHLVRELCNLRNRGMDVCLVSSGAREFDTLKSKKVPQSLEIGLFFCQIFIFII